MRLPLPISLLFSSLSLVLASDEEEPTSDKYRTNKGPLITQFEGPSSCLSEVRTRSQFGYPNFELGCEGPGGNDCCPSQWNWSRYYSPGVCPLGYQTCTLPSSKQRQETTNLCCPEAFDCATHIEGNCRSWLNTPIPTVYTSDGKATTQTLRVVYATNIQIRYQASDSSVVPVPTDKKGVPPLVDPPLTPAEKGGIAVGAIAGALALVGAGYFIGRRFKKTQQPYNDIALQHTTSDSPPPYPGK